jgi:hypothetical protein
LFYWVFVISGKIMLRCSASDMRRFEPMIYAGADAARVLPHKNKRYWLYARSGGVALTGSGFAPRCRSLI